MYNMVLSCSIWHSSHSQHSWHSQYSWHSHHSWNSHHHLNQLELVVPKMYDTINVCLSLLTFSTFLTFPTFLTFLTLKEFFFHYRTNNMTIMSWFHASTMDNNRITKWLLEWPSQVQCEQATSSQFSRIPFVKPSQNWR